MKRNSTLFTPEFEREIARSEYQRTRLIIALFIVATSAAVINYFFLDESIIGIYGGSKNYFFVIGWLGVFTLYEVVILQIISFLRRTHQRVTEGFRYTHTLIEITFPSLLILYMVDVKDQWIFVDSPVGLIYFFFITLSVLHLDFKLSLITAVLAAIEYSSIVYFGFHFADTGQNVGGVFPENSFYLRGIVLIINGVAGGFVAEELKKRIQTTVDLQRSKNEMEVLFGQQVSREILLTLVEDRGLAKKHEATVLAMDIRNFTAFAETHTPDEIMDYQNKIFGPVIDFINQHQGVVNQIMGDGMMATFGTPVPSPLHSDMAFEASLKIRNKLAELVRDRVIPETKIGLGLHTGDVITGNIGTENRKQYSISGSAVIIAFRVEQLNKEFGSDLLITDAVKNRVAPGKIQLTSLGLQPMRGFGYAVEVFQVGA